MNNEINWTKYFDHIFCITYVNNGRYNSIIKELDRVGILTSGIFEFVYDVDHKYKDIMHNIIPADWIDRKQSKILTIIHYKIWKICKELNFNRVLILEDDVAFLKDINKLKEYLETTNFYDITLFDYTNSTDDNSVNSFFSTACYSINKLGADVLSYNFEKNSFTVCDTLLFTKNIISCTITSYNSDYNLRYNQELKNYYLYDIGEYNLNYTNRIAVQCQTSEEYYNKCDLLPKVDKNDYNIWM